MTTLSEPTKFRCQQRSLLLGKFCLTPTSYGLVSFPDFKTKWTICNLTVSAIHWPPVIARIPQSSPCHILKEQEDNRNMTPRTLKDPRAPWRQLCLAAKTRHQLKRASNVCCHWSDGQQVRSFSCFLCLLSTDSHARLTLALSCFLTLT